MWTSRLDPHGTCGREGPGLGDGEDPEGSHFGEVRSGPTFGPKLWSRQREELDIVPKSHRPGLGLGFSPRKEQNLRRVDSIVEPPVAKFLKS